VRAETETLSRLRSVLRNPRDLVQATETLIAEKVELEKKLESLNQERVNAIRERLESSAVSANGRTTIISRVSLPSGEALKNIAYALRNRFDDLVLVLAADVDGKPQVGVMLGEKIVAGGMLHAGNLVRELAREIEGGGGGQPFFATAGGKNLEGLERVISRAATLMG